MIQWFRTLIALRRRLHVQRLEIEALRRLRAEWAAEAMQLIDAHVERQALIALQWRKTALAYRDTVEELQVQVGKQAEQIAELKLKQQGNGDSEDGKAHD